MYWLNNLEKHSYSGRSEIEHQTIFCKKICSTEQESPDLLYQKWSPQGRPNVLGRGYMYVFLIPEINEPETRMSLLLLCPRLEGSAVRLLRMFSIFRSGMEARIDWFCRKRENYCHSEKVNCSLCPSFSFSLLSFWWGCFSLPAVVLLYC